MKKPDNTIPLGRLWDIAHSLGLEYEFPLELTSNELTEALVAALEDYYRNENKNSQKSNQGVLD